MNEKIKIFSDKGKACLAALIFSALTSWLISLTVFSLTASERITAVPDFADGVSLPLFISTVALLTAVCFLLHILLWDKTVAVLFPLSFCIYGAVSVAYGGDDSDTRAYSALVFCLLALAVIALTWIFMKKQGIDLPRRDISPRLSFIIVTAGFVLFSAFFIVLLWSRSLALCSPCYDLGIFTQMYDNMAESFLPMTTCERGEHLSHFAVHFSPILYLLLPFCYITDPVTMLVFAQVILVFSAVFPLWLICRRAGLSATVTTVVSLLFLLYPAMSSGAFYDFHENAFLAPLILWTLYFVHAEKWIPTFIFALGVLTVKEDAAMYVGFIALYMFFSRRKYWQGALMLVMTLGYFLFATHMLLSSGEGVMLGSRYYNVIGYDGSFVDLIKVALVDPALYAIESMNTDKLLYALNMLLPLAFLPLMTDKPSRWLLIAPLFVINLVTDYVYQYDLGFQYSFGSGALMTYLAAVNLADIIPQPAVADDSADVIPDGSRKLKTRLGAAVLAFALFASVFLMSARLPSQSYYVRLYSQEKDDISTANEVLASIDRDKSVMATSMYLTPLYDVDELYHSSQVLDDHGYIKIFTDVVVLDLRPYMHDASKADDYARAYLLSGYEITTEIDDLIMVLERKE